MVRGIYNITTTYCDLMLTGPMYGDIFVPAALISQDPTFDRHVSEGAISAPIFHRVVDGEFCP